MSATAAAPAIPTQFDRHLKLLTDIFAGGSPAPQFDRNLKPRERNGRLPRLALRRRSADHPMVMFAIVAGAAFASMAFVPPAGPAFASFGQPARLNEDVRTTAKLARIPFREADIVCRGQAWTGEDDECLRQMALDSGVAERKVRRLADAAIDASTPNIF